MRRVAHTIGSLTLALLAISCSASSSSSPSPTPVPGDCATAGATACAGQVLGCPAAPSANAQPHLAIATCAFSIGGAGCEPIQLPVCQVPGPSGYQFHVAQLGDLCVGDVRLDVESGNGGTIVRWVSQEMRAGGSGGCVLIGTVSQGIQTVAPCCDATVDLPMPDSNVVFRIRIHTDWLAAGG